MEPSPYAPGSLPEYLAGRGPERDLIRDRVARLTMLGRSGGPLLAFHAPQGLGKTSLLRIAQRDAISEGFLTVWTTGRSDELMSPRLAQSLSAALQEKPFGKRATKGLLHRLKEVQVEFGIPSAAKIGATVNTESAPAPAVIEELLEDAGKLARDHDHKGLAVFVDELQEAQVADRKSLLIALQHFDGDPAGCPVAVVAAGLPSLSAAVTEAATFGERSRFVELGLLREVAVAEALRLPAKYHGVGWSNEAIDVAISASEGYPHKVQLLGQSAWEAARPDRGDVVQAGHVRLASEVVEKQMVDLYRTRLARTTHEQYRLLMAMAEIGGDAPSRREIADHLGVTSNALSRARQELIDHGYIEPAGHGRLRFTIPGFGTYLHENG